MDLTSCGDLWNWWFRDLKIPLDALGRIIFLRFHLLLITNWRAMDLDRHLQGTPRRLLFWMPAAPPFHLQWPITAVLLVPCLPTVPARNRASVDSLWPPAKPPPNFTQSFTSSTTSSPLFSPTGSSMALLVYDGPSRPAPFDFGDADGDMDVLLPDSLRGPPSLRSVTQVVTCPRVLGFCGDGHLYACINLTALASSKSPGSLINGGANICLTEDLGLLTDVVAIPPMPILVALQGEITIDDCCTASGTIPLLLDDGSIYWQDCYYSKNVVKPIITLQAIVNSSDIFQSWHQSGYRIRDPTLGCIRFNTHDGLVGMSMTLVHH
jgi:hypothetical protein